MRVVLKALLVNLSLHEKLQRGILNEILSIQLRTIIATTRELQQPQQKKNDNKDNKIAATATKIIATKAAATTSAATMKQP